MINYIFGVQYTDKHRFQLIVENALTQTDSVTKIITKYTIHNSKFHFVFSVIDIPGFGDTTGREEDTKTISKLKSLFSSGIIVSIDAICFVANYNDNRLTEFEKYIFENITNIFGKDVGNNIFIMTTCCDDMYDEKNETIKKSVVLEHFKKLNIPFKNSFPFNNKGIFDKPVEGKKMQTYFLQWDTSTTSFKFFFEELDNTYPVSLVLTNEVLQRQHNIIYVRLPAFVRKIQQSIHTIDRHKEVLNKLQQCKDLPDKDFTISVQVQKETMVDITESGIYCIMCSNCTGVVCHYPCNVPENQDIKKCSIMSWKIFTKDICTACPRRCPWTQHKRLKERPGYKTVTEYHTNYTLRNEYLKEKRQYQDQKAQWEALVRSCEAELISAYHTMLDDLENTQKDIDFLNKECLSKIPTTLEKKIKDIVEDEIKSKENGFEKRIEVLENLISTMKQRNIFKDFKDASSEDKLKQAKTFLLADS